jgi:5-hydroxyisourate hydrolase
MSGITTHVLDTARGMPAAGVPVVLEVWSGEHGWQVLGSAATDPDGRARNLVPASVAIAEGTYRLTFDVRSYFQAQPEVGFFPEVSVVFSVRDPAQHYHVPLLLSPFGYTTYRGS